MEAKNYRKTRSAWVEGILFQIELREVKRKFKIGPTLEVGVGAGKFLPYLSNPGFVGMDISSNQLSEARTIAKFHDVDLVCADASHLPFKDSYFENVICSRSIKFFPNLEHALAEFSRVTVKLGHVFIASDYSRDNLFYRLFVPAIYKKTAFERHYSLSDILHLNPTFFNVLSVTTTMFVPPILYEVLAQRSPTLARPLGRLLEKIDRKVKIFGKGWAFFVWFEVPQRE